MTRSLWLFAVLTLTTCRAINPDVGTYSCSTTADCASTSLECRPQFAGGGRCFAVGTCQDVELCNGVDDTCDGRVDETFPELDAACQAARPGVCAAGKKACAQGAVVCESTRQPSAETCNALDDDCNGSVDESFDLSTNSAHCGACNRACASGTVCRDSQCIESRCDDGLDNDQNGSSDCADERCFGADCDTTQAPASRCGFAPVSPDAGIVDGGADGGDPDAGSLDAGINDAGTDAGFVRGCFRPELACDDGLDNDGDGAGDCADPDCDGKTCFSGQLCSQRTCPGPG